ncbi:MAG TPA: hypothetical protein P5048_03145, partial [Chlamydiales bacterium]|nr:hypothetical protein [Chlamydiales bacterium]
VEAGVVLFEIAQLAYQISFQIEQGEEISEDQIAKLASLLEDAQKKIKQWNISLFVRLFQQILYLIATPIAIYSQAISFGLMGLGTMIALYMDTSWKFRRNTPTVVPGCTKDVIEWHVFEEGIGAMAKNIKSKIRVSEKEEQEFLDFKLKMDQYLKQELNPENVEDMRSLLDNVKFDSLRKERGLSDIERLERFKKKWTGKRYSLEMLFIANFFLLQAKLEKHEKQVQLVVNENPTDSIVSEEEAS